jgi:biopolymer transport protein ExbB/TolQ
MKFHEITDKLVGIAHVTSFSILVLLLLLSVVSIGVIIERWWYFRRRRLDVERLSALIAQALRRGDVHAAQAAARAERAEEAQALAEALAWYGAGSDAFREVFEKAMRMRRRAVSAGQVFLGTLGNNAPFIGLFGTVLGVVTAFQGLGSAQANAMGSVMSAIAEALIATAIGIFVAIPAVVAYNVFDKRAELVEENAAALGNVVQALMSAGNRAPVVSSVEGGLATPAGAAAQGEP